MNTRPIEIARQIYWVGVNMQESGLHCNPYLIVAGDEAAVADAGGAVEAHCRAAIALQPSGHVDLGGGE